MKLKNFCAPESVFINYFWFYTLCAIIGLVIHQEWPFNLGFPLILYSVFLKKGRSRINNIIDILWILSFIWICITWIFSSFPHKAYIIVRCFMAEIAFMFTYWIGKNSSCDYFRVIITKAQKPLVITCLIGIYCFLFEPAWYLSIIDRAVAVSGYINSKENVLDQYRLRSVFDGAYPLAYMCCLALIYEFFCYFTEQKFVSSQQKRYKTIFVMLLVVTEILCMMRAPIFMMLCAFLLSCCYSYLYLKGRKCCKLVLFGGVIISILFYVGSLTIDNSILNFMFSKLDVLTDGENSFVADRLLLQQQSSSLFGEGFGKYSAVVYYKFGMPMIPDGEYMKILAEQGIVGLVLTSMMFFIGICKAGLNFRFLYLELCILCMLLICMIGADPLSISDKHCFIYWLVLGRVSSFNVRNAK